MAKKKETERVESGFLSGAVSRNMTGDDPQQSAPEIDWEAAKRSLRNYSLHRRVERLESEEAARKRAANIGRKCELWLLVAAVKRTYPDRRSDQEFIASRVDRLLEKQNGILRKEGKQPQELREVCPKPWRKVPQFPRTMIEVRSHKVLKGLVAQFISKVKIVS